MKIRPQYHLRDSDHGLLAWDVIKLIKSVSELTPIEIDLDEISEFDDPYWFDLEGDLPTCRTISEHARLIEEANPAYPIILDPDGRVMDGMHRVCKAIGLGHQTIQAYRLQELPKPDFTGVAPGELPYSRQ